MIDSMRSSIFGFCSRRRTTSCARRLISLRFDEVIPSLLQTTERLCILKCIEFQLFLPRTSGHTLSLPTSAEHEKIPPVISAVELHDTSTGIFWTTHATQR